MPARRRTVAGWPTARRTRSRCAPSTTSARAPASNAVAGPHARRAGPGRWAVRWAGGRDRIDASWSAPNDNGKPITHYHVDRIPGGVAQRGRPLARLERPARRHPLHGPRPGLQRDRLRRVERDQGRPHRPAAAAPREVTWSSYGSAQGQPRLQLVACAATSGPAARASSPATTSPSPATAASRAPSRRPVARPTAPASSSTTPPATSGTTSSFWITMDGVESDHRHWPG